MEQDKQKQQQAEELVSRISEDDVHHVLRALEKRFQIRTSVIDRSEINEIAASYFDTEITDEQWAEFTSTAAWEDWNVDSWEAWKDFVGMSAVRELVEQNEVAR
jgi:uncharacterized protein